MPKQKTRKSVSKKISVTSSGKLLKRHQFSAGHLKRNKSKSALNMHKKTSQIFKGEAKAVRRMLGI